MLTCSCCGWIWKSVHFLSLTLFNYQNYSETVTTYFFKYRNHRQKQFNSSVNKDAIRSMKKKKSFKCLMEDEKARKFDGK